MRLLLDELWDYEVAVQLRRRGFDVVAATEPEPSRSITTVNSYSVME